MGNNWTIFLQIAKKMSGFGFFFLKEVVFCVFYFKPKRNNARLLFTGGCSTEMCINKEIRS